MTLSEMSVLGIPSLVMVLLCNRGISQILFGLDTVCHDGTPANRFRRSYKILLVWIPILPLNSVIFGDTFLLPELTHNLCLTVFFSAILYALFHRHRNLYDILTSTWTVKR